MNQELQMQSQTPDALRFGRRNAELHAAFGIHLRILFAALIRGRRFPIVRRWFVFRGAEMAAQNRRDGEE